MRKDTLLSLSSNVVHKPKPSKTIEYNLKKLLSNAKTVVKQKIILTFLKTVDVGGKGLNFYIGP